MIVELVNDSKLVVRVDSEVETEILTRALAEVVGAGIVIGLVGTLGAGKTRLVRGLAEALGVDSGAIASPTFVLIHEYSGRLPIYHFDAYRLADPDAFDSLGASDYWSGGEGLCLIEWADLVVDSLPTFTWWIRIELEGSKVRVITIDSPAVPRLAELLRDPSI